MPGRHRARVFQLGKACSRPGPVWLHSVHKVAMRNSQHRVTMDLRRCRTCLLDRYCSSCFQPVHIYQWHMCHTQQMQQLILHPPRNIHIVQRRVTSIARRRMQSMGPPSSHVHLAHLHNLRRTLCMDQTLLQWNKCQHRMCGMDFSIVRRDLMCQGDK